MTTPDHAARIAEIRRQLEAATPGPWVYETDDEGCSMGWVGYGDPIEPLFAVLGDSAQQESNAEFAASAPENIQYLLDRVAELEHQLGEPTEPTDIVTAFEELSAASGDTWDGVDAQQYVRELREADRTTNGADAMTMLTQERLAEIERRAFMKFTDAGDFFHLRNLTQDLLSHIDALNAELSRRDAERTEAERLLRCVCERVTGTPVCEQSGELADIAIAIELAALEAAAGETTTNTEAT